MEQEHSSFASMPIPGSNGVVRALPATGEAVKRILGATLATLALLLPAFAMAASDHDTHAGYPAQGNRASDSSMSEGIVRKVDKAAARVTVAHGPLTNLNMPAMTMVFRVKDAAWLDRMRTDSKIRFQAETINGALTIVRLESAQ